MNRYKIGDRVSHHPNNGKNRIGEVVEISNDDDRFFTYKIRFDDGSGRQWVHPKNMNMLQDNVNPNSMVDSLTKF